MHVVKTEKKEPARRDLEARAYLMLCGRRLSTEELAEELGVSWSTAARAIAALRRQGVQVVSVRESRDCCYFEIRGAEERARARWSRSRLRRMAGFAKGRGERLKPEDEAIYGRD